MLNSSSSDETVVNTKGLKAELIPQEQSQSSTQPLLALVHLPFDSAKIIS